jgi:hypothetical protein
MAVDDPRNGRTGDPGQDSKSFEGERSHVGTTLNSGSALRQRHIKRTGYNFLDHFTPGERWGA